MNYQLARTNTYIGGQMKLDLTLNRGSDELYIEDFHMSPVSNYTGYAWGTDSELLNNRHSENISDYYAKTKNFFFEDCLNPALDTKYPLYSPNYPIDTHDNDCLMGLYRLDRKTYGKSYGFFCPFWITDPDKFLETKFVFKVFKYRNINPVDDVVYTYTEEEWNERELNYVWYIASNETMREIAKEQNPQEEYESSAEYETRITNIIVDEYTSAGQEICMIVIYYYLNSQRPGESDEEYKERIQNLISTEGYAEYMNSLPPIKTPVCRTSLNMHELVGKEFHNKFVNYFNEYMQGFASHKYDIKESKFKTTNVTSDAYKLNIDGQEITQKKTKIEETKAAPFLSNDLVYISLKNGEAWVKGIDPETGAYSNKDISYICSTLLERERPLMDNDYYLARIFKDNSVIAQQLVNFNFIFDFADIVPFNVYEDMQYSRFGIEVYMYQEDDNEELHRIPLKDFYSNYEYIPMTYIHNNDDSSTNTDLYINYSSGENPIVNRNVLDYKKNANFIEYVYKNKLLQNTFHWVIENSQYIFNLYDGFSPIIVTKENDELICTESSGNMPFTANISLKEIEPGDQNILWVNYYKDFFNTMTILENFKSYYTHFSINDEWINGVKYDFSDIDANIILNNLNKYFIPQQSLNSINTYITEGEHIQNIDVDNINQLLNERIFIVLNNNGADNININIHDWENYKLVTFSAKRDFLTFQAIRDRISDILEYCTDTNSISNSANTINFLKLGKVPDNKNLTKKVSPMPAYKQFAQREYQVESIEETVEENDTVSTYDENFATLYIIYYLMNRAIPQTAIRFNKSYVTKIADSPSAESLEVSYKQPDLNILKTVQQVLYRYDGNIRPMFINVHRASEYEEDEQSGEEHLLNYSNFIVQYEESLDSIPQYNNENAIYQPSYPSIGYSSIASETIDYSLPGFVQYYGDSSANVYCGERRWYDGSFMYFLPQTIVLTEQSQKLTDDIAYNAFVKEVLNRIGLYPIEDTEMLAYYSRIVMNYILPLYTLEFSYEKLYEPGTNVPILENNSFIYTYKIKFELL